MSLGQVVIAVSSLNKATNFYLSALEPLGYRLIEKRSSEAGIGTHHTEFWLSEQKSRLHVVPTHTTLPSHSRSNVRIFFTAALQGGATVAARPESRNNGLEYSGAIVDPDGNVVELVCRSSSEVQSAGRSGNESNFALSHSNSPSTTTAQRAPLVRPSPSAATEGSIVPGILSTIMSNCSSLMSAKPTGSADSPANNDADVRESDPRTLVGTLLGAAAGAALTYALCKSNQHSRREAEWQDALEQNRAAQTQSNQLHAQTNQMLASALQGHPQIAGPNQQPLAIQAGGQIQIGQNQMYQPALTNAITRGLPSQAGQMMVVPSQSSVGSAFYNCQPVSSVASSSGTISTMGGEGLPAGRSMRMIEPAGPPSVVVSQQSSQRTFRSGPYATVETVYMSTDDLAQPPMPRRGSYPSSQATSHLLSPNVDLSQSSYYSGAGSRASSRRSLSQATTLTPEALAAMSAVSKQSGRQHSRVDSVLQSTASTRQSRSHHSGMPAEEDLGELSSDDSIVPSDSISNVGTRVSATTAASRRTKARSSHSHRKSRKGDELMVVQLDDLPEEDEDAAEETRTNRSSGSKHRSHSRTHKSSRAGTKSAVSRSSRREADSGGSADQANGPGSLLSGLTFNLFKNRQASSGEEGERAPKGSVAPSHRTSKTSSRSNKPSSSASAAGKSHSSRARTSEPEVQVYSLPDDYPVTESRSGGSRAGTARPESKRTKSSAGTAASTKSGSRLKESGTRPGSTAGSVAQWRDSVAGGPTADRDMASLHEDVRSRMRI